MQSELAEAIEPINMKADDHPQQTGRLRGHRGELSRCRPGAADDRRSACHGSKIAARHGRESAEGAGPWRCRRRCARGCRRLSPSAAGDRDFGRRGGGGHRWRDRLDAVHEPHAELRAQRLLSDPDAVAAHQSRRGPRARRGQPRRDGAGTPRCAAPVGRFERGPYPMSRSPTAKTLDTVRSASGDAYKYGFVTDIESESAPPGLNEDTIRFISAKKREPEWLLEWRLKAFRDWQKMEEPHWANLRVAPIDYQVATYYSAPKRQYAPKSLDEVDPELLRTYEKLGIPLSERAALACVAVDAVFDSISVASTFKKQLGALGIIFCSFGEAVQEHPELLRQYLGPAVPAGAH